ncbi:oligosaccharide flippase family protein [Mycobacterium sp. M1]|uniref:Oligosaccharide flippase family protein n=1 Tax=Mycolicibacter acidiphilus TaxID=2835306 RepID=A0ABS5RGS5_9MYCO|nr:oligosaccharide flippase family protein [Mycolicibacter acidiphilus]MBS9533497.1 oligosaccharide flippase family protein [Mycolicibacter acidiphilus]
MAESTTAVKTAVPQSQIAHAFAVQLGARLIGMVASVISVTMTARYLGPGRYGQLLIAVAFIGMWASLADLGIGTVIVRRVTSGHGELERLVRVNSGLSLAYCLPLAGLAVGSGVLTYRDHDVRVMLAVLSGQLLMLTMTSRLQPVFLTMVRFSAVAVSDVVSRVGMLATISVLVTRHADVIWFAVAQLVPWSLQLLVQGVAASRHISLRPIFSLRESADLVRESLPLTGAAVVGILYWRTDGVILSLLSTHGEVGVYGLAYMVAFNVEMLSAFFLKSTLSTATELFARDIAAFAAFLRRSVELMCFAAVPIAVVGALVAGPLIGLFGDQAFVDRGGPTLALLFGAAALRFVTGTLGQGLIASHQQQFFFRMFIVSFGLNVVLNVVLDGRFGAVGAAAALAGTELFGLAIANWWMRRQCAYRTPVAFLARTLVPTAFAVAITLLLSGQHVVLTLIAAGVGYAAVSLAMGPVSWATVKSMFGRKAVA